MYDHGCSGISHLTAGDFKNFCRLHDFSQAQAPPKASGTPPALTASVGNGTDPERAKQLAKEVAEQVRSTERGSVRGWYPAVPRD